MRIYVRSDQDSARWSRRARFSSGPGNPGSGVAIARLSQLTGVFDGGDRRRLIDRLEDRDGARSRESIAICGELSAG